MVILEVTADSFNDKYFGHPVTEGHMKAGKFLSTQDNFLIEIFSLDREVSLLLG